MRPASPFVDLAEEREPADGDVAPVVRAPAARVGVLRPNPAVSAHPFDAQAREPMMICEVPSAGDQVARFAIPLRLFALLERFDGETDTTTVIRRACAELPNIQHDETTLARFVNGFLVHRRLLLPANDPAPLPPPASPDTSPLYFRVPLLSARAVNAIADRLTWLYTPWIGWTLAAGVLIAHAVFYIWILPTHALRFGALSPATLLATFLVAGASTFAHELGHATAAVRGGCRRVTIGAGVYLYMIVGYADLSEVWRLPRRQRVLADVGGVYFQGVFASLLLMLYLGTGWQPALFAVPLADVAIAASINPFLRLDGYWVVSDLTGIANLRARSRSVFSAWWTRLWGRRGGMGDGADVWPMPARATTILVAYTLLSSVFFVWLAIQLSTLVLWNLLYDYPHRLAAVPHELTRQPLSAMHVAAVLLSLAIRTAILVGITRFMLTLGANVLRFARSASDAHRSRNGNVLYTGGAGKA